MRPAPQRLVRCHQLPDTRDMIDDIRAETGEPNWLVLYRAVLAEWLRLFHPEMDGLAEE